VEAAVTVVLLLMILISLEGTRRVEPKRVNWDREDD
jgi:hypothetical protein